VQRSWRWVLTLGGSVLVVAALYLWWNSRPAPSPSASSAVGCPAAVRDSLEAGLARLGGRSRAAGAHADLATLHLLSDSVDSMRQRLRHRCPADSSVVAP
jgi:hypothetical protein